MGGEGVPAEDVIRVLRSRDVLVVLTDEKTRAYTIERGDFLECHILKGEVVSKLLHYFKRKLNIPIHLFWNPEQAEAKVEATEKKE